MCLRSLSLHQVNDIYSALWLCDITLLYVTLYDVK